MTIGQAMRKARKDKGYTLKKLEAKTGISRVSLSRYERGECFPGILSLLTIADVLGITLDELVGRTAR
jgi:transcriptional regulator with XRE-family HTH domain